MICKEHSTTSAYSSSRWTRTLHRSLVSSFAIFVLLTSLLLSACSSAPAVEVTAAPQTGGTIVVDALGRTVRFPQPPRRIAIAGKSALVVADAAYMFPEAKERVVALVRARQNVGDFLAFIDPDFDKKTLMEIEAGPEQIASVNPDVVVLKSYMAEKLGRPLEEIGMQVVYVDLETPEQFFRDLVTLGQLFGNETRAEKIQSFYQSRLDRVDQSLRGLREEQKPPILILQYSQVGGEVAFNVPSASWIQTTQAESAGAIPIWKKAAQGAGWNVVNFEQIAAWNPDKLFIIDYRSDSAQVVEKLKTDPQWRVLKAVKEGQIFGFAADIFSWDQPDPRWILGLVWLAVKTHPDRFPGVDMVQEIYEFFGQMYGMEEASITQYIMPSLKGDIK